MNSLKFFSLILCALPRASYASDSQCKLRDKFLHPLNQSSTRSFNDSLSSLGEDTEMIFFGENHRQAAAPKTYPQLISAASKKGYDCLFLEADTLEAAKRWDNYGLFEAAETNSLKLIATDFQPDPVHLVAQGQSSMDFRNRHMAQTIKESFETGQCRKGLMFVGKHHLSWYGDEKTSLPKYLQPKQMQTRKI